MDIPLKYNECKGIEPLYMAAFSHEETLESIVPDAMPDINRILAAEGTVLLRSKDVTSSRVTVSGVVQMYVLYAPENADAPACCLDLQIPFRASADDQRITENCFVMADIDLSAADARALNPRKILAKIDLQMCVECFGEFTVSVPCALEGETDGLETDMRCIEAPVLSVCSEKVFDMSDVMTISSQKRGMRKLLSSALSVLPTGTDTVGQRCVARYAVMIRLVYISEDNELEGETWSEEYSQVFDCDCTDGSVGVSVMPTSVYLTPSEDGRSLTLDLYAVLQYSAAKTRRFEYISDVYSTKNECEFLFEETSIPTAPVRYTAQGLLQTSIHTAAQVSKVICQSIRPCRIASDSGICETYVDCDAVCLSDDGTPVRAKDRVICRPAAGLECGDIMTAYATDEAYAAASNESVNIRAPITFTSKKYERVTIRCLAKASEDEEAPLSNDGVYPLVVKRYGGERIWDLAKKYRSSAPLILSVNGAADSSELQNDQIILIPRK